MIDSASTVDAHASPVTIWSSFDLALERWIEERLRNPETLRSGLHAELLSQLEPILFRKVLELCQWQRGKAADLLGIHRGTLRDKLRDYQLDGE